MPAHTASHGPAPATAAAVIDAHDARHRLGYLAAAGADAVLILLVNVWPGWQSVSVLTPSAAEVVTLLNLTLVAGVVMSLLQVVSDAAWLHWLAESVTGALGLSVLMRTLRVFPFTFAGEEWAWGVRLGLVLLIAVAAIALVAAVVRIIAELVTHEGVQRR